MEIQPRFPIGMRLYVEGGSIRLHAKQNRVLIAREVARLSKLDYFRFFEIANLINQDSVDLCRLRTHFPCHF